MANRTTTERAMHSPAEVPRLLASRVLLAFLGLLTLLSAGAPRGVRAAEILAVQPLTDRIVVLHIKDGHVIYHKIGQKNADDQVTVAPLDMAAASKAETYGVASTDDPAYAAAKQPASIGRKSKASDFASHIDTWVNNRAVNTQPDHVEETWLYLTLPEAMQRGKTYTIQTGALVTNGAEWKLTYDEKTARSEAVHVNLMGYVPAAPQKFAYVFHWMGDQGGLDLKPYDGRPFHLVDQQSHEVVFTGKIVFRMPKTAQETFHKTNSPPDGNFLDADVYECDFSAFDKPGTYVVAVEGVGCSFPFHIGDDVYREAFKTVAKGIYHQRSGIELKAPYTDFPRPAPHNPKLTPGFAGKLIYTTIRFTEWGSEGGKADTLLAASKGPLDSYGWYQDAGDWDSYYSHPRVAQELLFAYELAPRNFTDKELNIPESSDGVPDILDEAAWLPRFCLRLRTELLAKNYATGGIGLRIAGDAFGSDNGKDGVNQGSWEDVNRTWAASGEDPWSTYRYAGTAAHLAYCLSVAGVKDPEGADWEKEARESYAWAQKNTRPGDDQNKQSLSDPRSYAAAALFRLTGEAAYEQQFLSDTAAIKADSQLSGDTAYGPWLYALGGGKGKPDAAALARIRGAVLHTADDEVLGTPTKRALRWGGNFSMPMLVGQQTTPWVLGGAVAYSLVREQDPAKAKQYLAGLYTTCDYFLGGNSLNMTWVTGLGARHPDQVFSLDAWCNGKEGPHPGIIPYGPWMKGSDQGAGPWEQAWVYPSLYPGIDLWPGNERWFGNRYCPMTDEFTVHQNMAPSAAIFGVLCAPGLAGQEQSRRDDRQ